MIGYYHSKDFDGYCSGAIMKRKFPNGTFIGYDYNEPFEITKSELIMMSDVSLSMDKMYDIAKACDFNFIWIDHHASAIKDYNIWLESIGMTNNPPYRTVLQGSGIAACELTWNYLFPNEKMPLAVKLLGEYDTWRKADLERWDNEILPFQFGMRQIANSLETFPMNLLESNNEQEVYKIIERGKIVLEYQAKLNETQCKRAFEFKFEGYNAICLNTSIFNSDTFNSVYDHEKHDIMIPFQWDGNTWTISLYSKKDSINCSIIAKSKGGGGHPKAAGFKVQDIRTIFPFL